MQAIRHIDHAAAEAAHAALIGALAAKASHPRDVSQRAGYMPEAPAEVLHKPLGIFGTVVQHRMPCPSDCDPGADDFSDEESAMLACIDEAETLLAQARELIESRKPAAMLAAQSRMTEAAGWLAAEVA